MPDDLDLVLAAVRKARASRPRREDAALVDDRHGCSCSSRIMHSRVQRFAQLVEHALQIRRQLARELHPPSSAGWVNTSRAAWRNGRSRCVHRRAGRPARADGRRRTANRRRSDGRWRSGGRGSDACGRCESPRRASVSDAAEMFGADDARDRFAAAARARRHLLAIRRVAPDRRVDPASGLHLAPRRARCIPSRPRGRGTAARAPRAPRRSSQRPSGPRCRDRADARCPAASRRRCRSDRHVMEQRVHERAARVAGRRMHDHARRLVDDDEVRSW